VVRADRWGRYPPGTVRVAGRAGAFETSVTAVLDPLEVFPRPARLRPRLVPAELLRRIGEHTGRAVGEGVEFAGLRPYLPGDQLRDVNRVVSLRRGQLHVNLRAAARAADLVVMIDAFGDSGPVSEASLDVAVHGAAALVTAYLRVSDRVGLVVLGGLLRWFGPAAGDRQFYRIAEMMLAARYDSFVTPDIGRIPRTALPPGTLVVVFSPLLDPRGFGAISDLRQRGFPLIVVETLRDEPPLGSRPDARLALRLWRLDRAATRSGLRALGVPVLRWDAGTELDSVLAPLRQPPPAPAAPLSPRRPGHDPPAGHGARRERGAGPARRGLAAGLGSGRGVCAGRRGRPRGARRGRGQLTQRPRARRGGRDRGVLVLPGRDRRPGRRRPVHLVLPDRGRRPAGPEPERLGIRARLSAVVGTVAQAPGPPGRGRPHRHRRGPRRARLAPGERGLADRGRPGRGGRRLPHRPAALAGLTPGRLLPHPS
jgi:uncharacterized protein DUF58